MKSFLEFVQNEGLQFLPSILAGQRQTPHAVAPEEAASESSRSQIRRNLVIISRKTGTDYLPILDALRSNKQALGLLDKLLQNLMTMSAGTGKALAGRMV